MSQLNVHISGKFYLIRPYKISYSSVLSLERYNVSYQPLTLGSKKAQSIPSQKHFALVIDYNLDLSQHVDDRIK